ncbi:MAG: hypothetical protein PQ964_02350 [Methanobacteriaceae archaeon]
MLVKKGIKELEDVAEVVVDTSITQEELINKIKDFDAIVVRSRTKVTRDVIEAADKLKTCLFWIQKLFRSSNPILSFVKN